MTEKLKIVIDKIAEEILLLATIILEDDSISGNPKTNKNNFRDSALLMDLKTSAELFPGGDIVIKALFNNYIDFIERGRLPKHGKQPPISALKDWAEKNGIPSDNNTLWAISTAIWRDGYAGRPILANLETQAEQLFDKEWADEIFETLVEQLDTYFK